MNFLSAEFLSTIEPFKKEVRWRLLYHSTYLVEMVGNVCKALNNVVYNRRIYTGDPETVLFEYPDGLSSDFIKELYRIVILCKTCSKDFLDMVTPHTAERLKTFYTND